MKINSEFLLITKQQENILNELLDHCDDDWVFNQLLDYKIDNVQKLERKYFEKFHEDITDYLCDRDPWDML